MTTKKQRKSSRKLMQNRKNVKYIHTQNRAVAAIQKEHKMQAQQQNVQQMINKASSGREE